MKAVLAITITAFVLAAVAAQFTVRVIARADGPLEPSVQNEVDYAISRAERWLHDQAPSTNAVHRDIFGTNGLANSDIAIRIVSMQKGKGWWITSTNPAPTRLAVEILKGL